MIRAFLAIALLCAVSSCGMTPAFAAGLHPRCNIDWPCARSENWTFVKMKNSEKSFGLNRSEKRLAHGRDLQRRLPIGVALEPGESAAGFIGSRPSGCPARAWCGCWLAQHLGMSDRSLWLARRWASLGMDAGGPRVGAIVVWRHHVGKITAVDGHRIRVLSGNDGRAVRDRWRTTAGVIAYRVAS